MQLSGGESLHIAGSKDDNEKILAGVLGDFSRGLTHVAQLGTFGARKYSRRGWQHVAGAELRYYYAMWRHVLSMQGNLRTLDPESKEYHLTAVAWNALALLELISREYENTPEV